MLAEGPKRARIRICKGCSASGGSPTIRDSLASRARCVLLRDLELCVGTLRRVGTDPYRNHGGLDHVLHVNIPERKLLAAERELDGRRFAGPDPDALESLELAHRAGHTGAAFADVELDHFLARTVPGVRDHDRK